jgi:hypothetical protein
LLKAAFWNTKEWLLDVLKLIVQWLKAALVVITQA